MIYDTLDFSDHFTSGVYPAFLWLFKEILPELRHHFSFHEHLLLLVEQWKQSIIEIQTKNVIFVGVHCRRTDYQNHLDTKYEKAILVDKAFFDVAFDIYRSRYDDEKNKVIFLAVSDDSEWIKVRGLINTIILSQDCSRPTWTTTLM